MTAGAPEGVRQREAARVVEWNGRRGRPDEGVAAPAARVPIKRMLAETLGAPMVTDRL
jgi:hypothetical protein